MDCGATCLRMIHKYYGKDTSLEKLFPFNQTRKIGTNLFNLLKAAEKSGFTAEAARLNFEDLKKVFTEPCIIHWNGDHFVVLLFISDSKIKIADPGIGILTIEKEIFLAKWERNSGNDERFGYVLFISNLL